MRVLIMVLSSDFPQYKILMHGQMSTWDAPKTYIGSEWSENTNVVYYTGSQLYCSDEYNMMHWKMKLALDKIWHIPFDFIFRTNSSAYIRKDKIYEFLKDKPTTGYYAGATGGNYHSGAGMIFTRDLAQLLRDEINSDPNEAEDGVIAGIFHKHGYEQQPGPLRLHFNFAEDKILEADYYRCKSEKVLPDGTLDRNQDIIAFNKLYKHFNG